MPFGIIFICGIILFLLYENLGNKKGFKLTNFAKNIFIRSYCFLKSFNIGREFNTFLKNF